MILSIFLVIALYFTGMLLFAIWDAYIGFGVEFDGGAYPPLGLALAVWPLVLLVSLPFIFSGKIETKLEAVKEARLANEKQKNLIRVANEKSTKAIMDQIEQEMSYVETESKNSGRSGSLFS